MHIPGDSPGYGLRDLGVKIVSMLCFHLSHEFNPLIKYSKTSGTSVIILRVVVEEDIEGE